MPAPYAPFRNIAAAAISPASKSRRPTANGIASRQNRSCATSSKIEQLSQAHGREQSRPDAAVRSQEVAEQPAENDRASVREQSRPDAADSRYVVRLESENAYLREQNDKKDQQLERRDRQIEAMIDRDLETNVLMQRLQEFIPRLPQPERRGEDARAMPHTDIPNDGAGDNAPAT